MTRTSHLRPDGTTFPPVTPDPPPPPGYEVPPGLDLPLEAGPDGEDGDVDEGPPSDT